MAEAIFKVREVSRNYGDHPGQRTKNFDYRPTLPGARLGRYLRGRVLHLVDLGLGIMQFLKEELNHGSKTEGDIQDKT